MSDVNAAAAEMFAAGKSVNAVATALFKGAWATAKKQYDAWRTEGGIAPESPAAKPKQKKHGKRRAAAKELPDGTGEAEPEEWNLPLKITGDRLDAMLGTFTAQEKADAVIYVLQQRMDALLEV
jgi:hypothetical protein